MLDKAVRIDGQTYTTELRDVEHALQQRRHVAGGALVDQADVARLLARVPHLAAAKLQVRVGQLHRHAEGDLQ